MRLKGQHRTLVNNAPFVYRKLCLGDYKSIYLEKLMQQVEQLNISLLLSINIIGMDNLNARKLITFFAVFLCNP